MNDNSCRAAVTPVQQSVLKPVSSCLFSARIIASSTAAGAKTKRWALCRGLNGCTDSSGKEAAAAVGTRCTAGHWGFQHWLRMDLRYKAPDVSGFQPQLHAGTVKAHCAYCSGWLCERGLLRSVLYLWATVSLKPRTYKARIILSNLRMFFIAFLKKKNFPEAIIFYSAHGHIQYHRHRVHLGKAKARIHVKKKRNMLFVQSSN